MTDVKCACGNTKHYAKGLCRRCYNQRPEVKAYRKAYRKAYNQRPEVKAYQKAYRKAYRKAYNQRPEVKAYRKAYDQRPEVKAYDQRPEVKAYRKAYRKAYNQRPEVKAYQKAYGQRPERKARVAELYRFSRPVKVPKGLREIQREYQQLLCRYGEKNGDIPRMDILRLEALSDYLGRDLEEWRLGKDKEAHARRLGD